MSQEEETFKNIMLYGMSYIVDGKTVKPTQIHMLSPEQMSAKRPLYGLWSMPSTLIRTAHIYGSRRSATVRSSSKNGSRSVPRQNKPVSSCSLMATPLRPAVGTKDMAGWLGARFIILPIG